MSVKSLEVSDKFLEKVNSLVSTPKCEEKKGLQTTVRFKVQAIGFQRDI